MTLLMKSELNALAASLALYEGWEFPDDYDFYAKAKKKNPDRARHFWNMAIVAWASLKNDDEALRFQVK